MAFQALEPMGVRTSGSGRALEFRLRHRVQATADPNTDTLAGILAHMAANGFFYGVPFSGFPAARCASIDAKVDKSDVKHISGAGRWDWNVETMFTTAFANDPTGQSGSGASADPQQRPARISVSSRRWSDVPLVDVDNAEVKNSAGDPVRRERLRSSPLIVIDKAVAACDVSMTLEAPTGYKLTRNADNFNPFGSYGPLFGNWEIPFEKGRIEEFTLDFDYNGGPYLLAHLEIAVDVEFGFFDSFWDEGYRAFNSTEDLINGVGPFEMLDSYNSARPSQPVPLDGTGLRLGEGLAKIEQFYQYYPARSWAPIKVLLGL